MAASRIAMGGRYTPLTNPGDGGANRLMCIEHSVPTCSYVLLGDLSNVRYVAPGALESFMCTHPRNGLSLAWRTYMTGTATINSTVAVRHDTRHLSYKRSTRPHVLIVDDDPVLREFMAQVLMAEGFDTDLARNGRDALDKARDNPPRVIVLDMMMPVMDGWTFRAHQRDCVTIAAIPVVVLSGVPLARVRDLGAAATLRKPVDTDELISAIRALC